VLDIEELVTVGRARELCPFYLPRSGMALADADLLLLPYAYLVDPAVRNAALADLDWSNTVVIFDEAHNISDVSAEAASFTLTAGDLARCIEELHAAISPFLAEAQAGTASAASTTSGPSPAEALSATLGFDPQVGRGRG
jgi:Rad3-related DNA helicase